MSMGKRAYDILRGYIGREWDRIESYRVRDDELELYEATRETTVEITQTTSVAEPPELTADRARRILGVSAAAPFAEIKRIHDRLVARTDAARFTPGTPEADAAVKIRRQVEWAFGVLAESATATDRRFGSLEVD